MGIQRSGTRSVQRLYSLIVLSRSYSENQAKAILQRMKIHMLNNSIQMCVDSKFNKYEVPVFCINEPLSYAQIPWVDKNLQLTYDQKEV